MEHGALQYVECVADDVKAGKLTSFPQSVNLKTDETVVFSWIAYRSRKHRDTVNAKVMNDERMPFDGQRMFWGGFKAIVQFGTRQSSETEKSDVRRWKVGSKNPSRDVDPGDRHASYLKQAAPKGPRMRFMIIVKTPPDGSPGTLPGPAPHDALAEYRGELARAGVLLDAAGLHPGRLSWRVRSQPGGRKVVEAPLDEGGGSITGYALIEVRSREEALEWSRRFPPGPAGAGAIEVRQVIEPQPPRPPAQSFR